MQARLGVLEAQSGMGADVTSESTTDAGALSIRITNAVI